MNKNLPGSNAVLSGFSQAFLQSVVQCTIQKLKADDDESVGLGFIGCPSDFHAMKGAARFAHLCGSQTSSSLVHDALHS